MAVFGGDVSMLSGNAKLNRADVTKFEELLWWEQTQYRAFSRWCNQVLVKGNTGYTCNGLEEFSDGVLINVLVETLSGKNLPKYTKTPKMKVQKCGNVALMFDFLKREKIHVENMGPEDLADQKLKLILGLIWTLLQYYQVRVAALALQEDTSKPVKDPKQAILDWFKERCAPWPSIRCDRWDDFNTGLPLIAAAFVSDPDLVPDPESLNPADRAKNVALAFDVLEAIGVPRLLDVADLACDKPDTNSVIAYTSGAVPILENYDPSKRKGAANKLLAAQCVAFGPGLEGARLKEETNFVVESPKGVTIKCRTVPDDTGINTEEAPPGSGNWLSEYTPRSLSPIAIHVTCNGVDIPNSPFRVPVTCDALECTAAGPGLHHARCGEPARFQIQAPNDNGVIKVWVEGPGDPAPVTVTPLGGGLYDVSYLPTRPGHYKVHVTCDDIPIPGSPFAVVVESDAPRVRATGAGLSHAVALEPAQFAISAPADSKGVIAVKVIGPDGRPCDPSAVKVTKLGDGNYDVNYVPPTAGRYVVHVTCDGEEIPNSPFVVQVAAPIPDAHKCSAYGPALVNPIAGRPAYFTVNVPAGMPVPLKATVRGPHGPVEVVLAPKRRGENAEPNARGAGRRGAGRGGHGADGDGKDTDLLNDQLNNLLDNDPNARGAGRRGAGRGGHGADGDGKDTDLLNDQLDGLLDNDPSARGAGRRGAGRGAGGADGDGKDVDLLGDDPNARGAGRRGAGRGGHGADGDGKDTDLLNDQLNHLSDPIVAYVGVFTPEQVGTYQLDLTVGADHVPDFPLTVNVIPGDARFCAAEGPGLHECFTDEPGEFKILMPPNSEGAVKVMIEGPSGRPKVVINETPEGRSVQYHATEKGPTVIHVIVDGEEIPNSPFRVNVLGPEDRVNPDDLLRDLEDELARGAGRRGRGRGAGQSDVDASNVLEELDYLCKPGDPYTSDNCSYAQELLKIIARDPMAVQRPDGVPRGWVTEDELRSVLLLGPDFDLANFLNVVKRVHFMAVDGANDAIAAGFPKHADVLVEDDKVFLNAAVGFLRQFDNYALSDFMGDRTLLEGARDGVIAAYRQLVADLTKVLKKPNEDALRLLRECLANIQTPPLAIRSDAEVQAARIAQMAPTARSLLEMIAAAELETDPYAESTVRITYAAREFQSGLPDQNDVRAVSSNLIDLVQGAIGVVETIDREEPIDAPIANYRNHLVSLLQLLKGALQRHRDAEEMLRKLGDCRACKQPIAGGTYWLADGQIYHKDCFKCCECSGSLATYHSVEGTLYCPPCYAIWREKNSIKCAVCNQMIVGQHVNTLGKRWHRECFTCTMCKKTLPVDYYNHNQMPFCSAACVQRARFTLQ